MLEKTLGTKQRSAEQYVDHQFFLGLIIYKRWLLLSIQNSSIKNFTII